jgi:hypothetical protein
MSCGRREELREARENREPPSRSSSSARPTRRRGRPFNLVGDDVYVIDPEDPEPATLEAAVRLARLLAPRRW